MSRIGQGNFGRQIRGLSGMLFLWIHGTMWISVGCGKHGVNIPDIDQQPCQHVFSTPVTTMKSDPALLDGLMSDPEGVRTGYHFELYYAGVRGDFSDPNRVQIFRATSPTAAVWSRDSQPMLSPGPPGTWDAAKVETPSVVAFPEGGYLMMYSGNSVPETEHGFQLGMATSPDGAVWSRRPQPVLPLGDPGSFDEMSLLGPSVVYRKDLNRFQVWYAGMSASQQLCVGFADSGDAIHWQKQGVVLELDVERLAADDPGILEIDVTWTGQSYEMVYSPLRTDTSGGPIWHATSANGLHWSKTGAVLDPPGPVPATGKLWVSSPSILVEPERTLIWYLTTKTDFQSFFDLEIVQVERHCVTR